MPAPSHNSDDLILQDGQVFVGKYLIGKELGRGGYGAVYLAEELQLKRKVAIKVLHPKHAKDKKTLRRFQIEAVASSRLNHPSVVQVYATGCTDDGTLYIAMEYVEGETLQARLKAHHARNQRLGSTKVLQVTLQVARVLAAAHDKGIYHRDLKPHNLMLAADDDAPGGERVKILDFGIAKLTPLGGGEEEDEGATSTGDQLPGTYAFMAPEQFGTYKGLTGLEGRMDVYALGVILYQAHAGRLPLYNADPTVMMGLALAKEPDPLRSIDPAIPPAVAELAHLMLSKEAVNRPTMAHVRDRLAYMLGLSASRPEIVPIRPTAEHEALLAKFSTGQHEESVAATGDAPIAGAPGVPGRTGATPSTAIKAAKSVGERSTKLQLTSGDLLMSTGRSVGQQVTDPDTSARRRTTRVLGAVVLGAVVAATGAGVVWIRTSGGHGTATTTQPIPLRPDPAPALPTRGELSASAATPASPKSAASSDIAEPPATIPQAEPTHRGRECTPVKVTDRCISGSPLTRSQQKDLLSVIEQVQIPLCPGDRLVIATTPRVEIRKASGVKRARLEDLSLALRGTGLSWVGDITVQCKRP